MYLIVLSIIFIWISILFLDTIFKTCMFYPYLKALYKSGLDIKPFAIYWRIARYNRYINRMGLFRPRLIKAWFQIGAVVTSAIFFPVILLYAHKLMSLFHIETPEEFESSKIVAVIPGYNFPWSYWKLYGCVLLICSLFHEFGHALAASRLGISVDNFGFALFLFAPVAFVTLRLDQFRHSSRWQQMYVFCAGIWHNIVLSLLCFLGLSYFTLLVSPLYNVGSGVQVSHIHELSALNQPQTGFEIEDHLYGLSNCKVTDFNSWNACLEDIENYPRGLCIPKILFSNESETVSIEKCNEEFDKLFFEAEMDKLKIGTCLLARTAVQKFKICRKYSECDEHTLCGLPHLPKTDRFIPIRRVEKPSVLYIGSVTELYMDVKVTEYLPKWKILSSAIPETIKEILQYVLIFSNGLACLNVLPIFSLDGRFILENLVHIFFGGVFSYEIRNLIIKYFTAVTYAVVCALIVVTAFKMSLFNFIIHLSTF